jgi:hypothetical protein
MREKISADGGTRNAAVRPHSPAHGGVDGGIDGSDRATTASNSGGRDGEAKRHIRAAARRAVRSGSGCLNSADGDDF